MADSPRKKPLDFDGNADHVTLRLTLPLGTEPPYSAWKKVSPGINLFNSNIFAMSAEVCTLLSASLLLTTVIVFSS